MASPTTANNAAGAAAIGWLALYRVNEPWWDLVRCRVRDLRGLLQRLLSLLHPVPYRQLVLLDLPRDLKAGLRNGFPPPPDPGLEAAFHQFVRDYAITHGWKETRTEVTQRAIRIMLGIQDTPGAAIRRSDVALLSRIKYSAAVVADVLGAAGMLEEDCQPAVVRWFALTVADLPTPMRRELDVWFDVMRNGSTVPPRRLPRAENTIGTQLRWALPTLRVWAKDHQSLREIGRDDVLAALPTDPLNRYTTVQGLRSIFRILKGRKLVFVNPTARIHAPSPNSPAPAPVELDKLREDLNSDAQRPQRSPDCWPSTPSASNSSAACNSQMSVTAACTSASRSFRWHHPSDAGWPPTSTTGSAPGRPSSCCVTTAPRTCWSRTRASSSSPDLIDNWLTAPP